MLYKRAFRKEKEVITFLAKAKITRMDVDFDNIAHIKAEAGSPSSGR
jgi:hypothetical protein